MDAIESDSATVPRLYWNESPGVASFPAIHRDQRYLPERWQLQLQCAAGPGDQALPERLRAPRRLHMVEDARSWRYRARFGARRRCLQSQPGTVDYQLRLHSLCQVDVDLRAADRSEQSAKG